MAELLNLKISQNSSTRRGHATPDYNHRTLMGLLDLISVILGLKVSASYAPRFCANDNLIKKECRSVTLQWFCLGISLIANYVHQLQLAKKNMKNK